MENKRFKEELSGLSAMFLGIAVVVIFSCAGNPAALGEDLYWGIAIIIFSLTAGMVGGIFYTVLTVWEKRSPSNFTTMKRKLLVKTNRLVDNWFSTTED